MINKLSIRDLDKDPSYYSGQLSEPVTLSMAKTHMFIESSFTDDDTYITQLITQCREAIESYCNISIQGRLITLTWSNQSNAGPYRKQWDRNFYQPPVDYGNNEWFELPYGPVSYIFSMTSVDANTLTPFVLNTDYYTQGTLFKSIQFNTFFNNVVVIYQTGYPPAKVPDSLKLAILNEVAFRYENRGDNTSRYAQQNIGICEASQYLANPFIRGLK